MNRKLFFSYVIGISLEVYEFTIFGLLASIIAIHFFPWTDNAMDFVFITFAIGFIVRPISAIFYGQWGDKK